MARNVQFTCSAGCFGGNGGSTGGFDVAVVGAGQLYKLYRCWSSFFKLGWWRHLLCLVAFLGNGGSHLVLMSAGAGNWYKLYRFGRGFFPGWWRHLLCLLALLAMVAALVLMSLVLATVQTLLVWSWFFPGVMASPALSVALLATWWQHWWRCWCRWCWQLYQSWQLFQHYRFGCGLLLHVRPWYRCCRRQGGNCQKCGNISESHRV